MAEITTTFTKGPWGIEYDVRSNNTIDVVVSAAESPTGFTFIACVDVKDEPDDDLSPPREIALANAHLISAAPDLYGGCNALIGLIQLVCGRDDMPREIKDALLLSHRMTEALEALAKAEGR
jgi:hypothetical protein